tara:strand:- start:2267 stop:3316 length:1050 start_codon:yes stop_codon:yes gene_type:complete
VQIKLCDIIDKLGAEVINPAQEEIRIKGLASLSEAGPDELSFYHDGRYLNDLKSTNAAAVLVSSEFDEEVIHVPLIKVKSPSIAFNEVAKDLYSKESGAYDKGIHPSAVIAENVRIDPATVSVGPNAVIGAGTTIGEGTTISAGVIIGSDVEVGENGYFYPNVVVYDRSRIGKRVIVHGGSIIGSDGFGFEFDGSVHQKIEHFGYVIIEDDVEIGANCTIDRGRFGKTLIGRGSKFDNLVQVGHNVIIGKNCIFVADTAIGGSCKIGDNVTMAAQVGVAGHIEIGSNTVLVARTGATKSLAGGEPGKPAFYSGFPAGPIERVRKEMVFPRRLPNILSRLKSIEDQLSAE